MKKLDVPFMPQLNRESPMHRISNAMNKSDRNLIEMVPWSNYNYQPKVRFSIAHGDDCLFLKYYVREQAIQAMYTKTNDPVYKDSCVEFFIAFPGGKDYYNFEFNCLGTCRSGIGTGRNERKSLPETVIASIKSLAVIKPAHKTQSDIIWQLTLMIPVEVFYEHKIRQLKGTKARVNFYKCGDNLPKPHYLAWNQIKAIEPNFHLPEFFGEMQLV